MVESKRGWREGGRRREETEGGGRKQKEKEMGMLVASDYYNKTVREKTAD